MPKGWVPAEHVGKVSTSILDVLAAEFFKESNKPNDEKDLGLLMKLSGACGYQAQLYSGLQKNIEYAQRLEQVEKDVTHVTPADLALGDNPVLKEEAEFKVKQDNR